MALAIARRDFSGRPNKAGKRETEGPGERAYARSRFLRVCQEEDNSLETTGPRRRPVASGSTSSERQMSGNHAGRSLDGRRWNRAANDRGASALLLGRTTAATGADTWSRVEDVRTLANHRIHDGASRNEMARRDPSCRR
ncbi:hypothetical protein KM043_012128 [Ampulex compressa]|nr:hypothetical protein KM043_012128 [Ampulex compressa]